MCKYSIFPKKNIFIFANIKISNNGRHKSFVRQALANSRPATYPQVIHKPAILDYAVLPAPRGLTVLSGV